ncbi:nucleotide-diphospho-sugar transferase, partial [Penicillium capsulatum]
MHPAPHAQHGWRLMTGHATKSGLDGDFSFSPLLKHPFISTMVLSPQVVRTTIVSIVAFVATVTLLRLPNPESRHDHDILSNEIDWSRFAYTQYATDRSYLCNSVMLFEALHRLGSKADRVMLYPSGFLQSEDDNSKEGRLLRFARDHYQVKLNPIEIQMKGGSGAPWSSSYTKLLAFNQTDYDRILHLDSDGTVLQSMDELFLLPPGPVAMPRAYWLDSKPFTSGLALIEPSTFAFNQVMDKVSMADAGIFDMEIMNSLFGDNAQIIPHRPYLLLTGEFRAMAHEGYLGPAYESWDAEAIFRETKYVHFSDWPVPKPWAALRSQVMKEAPICNYNPRTGQEDCRARDIWVSIYDDFKFRRE